MQRIIYYLKDKHTINEYINRFGFINDRDLAKELLCVSTNTWYILSDDVKKDSDVIMYYQPMGIGQYRYKKERYQIERELGYYFKRNSTSIPDSVDTYHSVCQDGFVAYKREKKGILQKPKIDYPEGFDFDKYFGIQKKLFSDYPHAICEKDDYYISIVSYKAHNSREFIYYDRAVLSQIIDSYNKKKNRIKTAV